MQTIGKAAEALYDALKDIVNAADNGEFYTDEELKTIFSPVLEEARKAGITGKGETPAETGITNHIATLDIGEDSILFVNGQLVASWQDGEFAFEIGLEAIEQVDYYHRHRAEELPEDWSWRDIISQLLPNERENLGLPKEGEAHV